MSLRCRYVMNENSVWSWGVISANVLIWEIYQDEQHKSVITGLNNDINDTYTRDLYASILYIYFYISVQFDKDRMFCSHPRQAFKKKKWQWTDLSHISNTAAWSRTEQCKDHDQCSIFFLYFFGIFSKIATLTTNQWCL